MAGSLSGDRLQAAQQPAAITASTVPRDLRRISSELCCGLSGSYWTAAVPDRGQCHPGRRRAQPQGVRDPAARDRGSVFLADAQHGQEVMPQSPG
jgi:hypothetical protein